MTMTILPAGPALECPDWCTIDRDGKRHSFDIVSATGEYCTNHEGPETQTPDGKFSFFVAREDTLTERGWETETAVWFTAPDQPMLERADLLALSDAARRAAEMLAEVLTA